MLVACVLGAGCDRAPEVTEDVRARVDGAYLVVENRSGTDIHWFVQDAATAGLVAWLPLSLPTNRLEDGRRLRQRIPPSRRGASVQVAWWRPGERIDPAHDVRGPDRIRRITVPLAASDGPASLDEQVVRACVEARRLWRASLAREPHPAAQAALRGPASRDPEEDCMERAEECLAGDRCASELIGLGTQIDELRRRLEGGR